MIRWTLALAIGLLAAWLAYGRAGATARAHRWWLGALRALAVMVVTALLVGAPAGRRAPLAPLVAVDASASWRRAVGDDSLAVQQWRRQLADTLRAIAPSDAPLVLVGDSLRELERNELATLVPNDQSSRIRAAVDRAASLGRSLLLVTDGELDDADVLSEAPPGSRTLVWPRTSKRDVAVAELALPANATGGDTVSVAVSLSSGAVATPDGQLQLQLDGTPVTSVAIPPLAPFASTRLTVALPLPRGTKQSVVTAIAAVASDVESRNDTLAATLDVGDRPSAVFVSTAPDLDVREALTVLRGALNLPTRAYLRVAPNVWRVEGALTPISEADVRARAAAAGMLLVHGDTTWLRTPSNTTPKSSPAAPVPPTAVARSAARALWTPAPPTAVAKAGELARTPEWYALAAPASPLAAALSALPVDSLPPITLAGPARGTTPVLTARLGKQGDTVTAVALSEVAGVRTVTISGSGYAGWALRGGRNRDAFTALWGAIFDWLAAGRGDVRAVRPAQASVRAGEPISWRRGGADSVVAARITSRDANRTTRIDSVRFRGAAFEATTAPLPSGIYDVVADGGASLLVVNASREWIPRAPTTTPAATASATGERDTLRLVEAGWPFLVALLLLSAEWIGRRAVGQR